MVETFSKVLFHSSGYFVVLILIEFDDFNNLKVPHGGIEYL